MGSLRVGHDWVAEDEMTGWHHWLDGCKSQWTPGAGDGQEGLACCDSWGRKESGTTERLIWSDLIWATSIHFYLNRNKRIWGSNTILTLCKIGTSKAKEMDLALGLQRVWCICDGGESLCHLSCLLSHLLPLQKTWVSLTAPLVVLSRNASIPKPRSLMASFGMKCVLSIPLYPPSRVPGFLEGS